MSFLSIPNQEGLFTTVKTARSTEEGNVNSPVDEDDEDDPENVRLIPRSSPVPRKRGHSIFDETAEYMRIRLALPARRVSFADSTGGELVDVKEFVAFDDDDGTERWKQEEAKYHRPLREVTYSVSPDYLNPTSSALTLLVHTNKVEVEELSPVKDEPLSISGIIRVLNISFQKAVYIRSTMDSWSTYFDLPAEYVHGSNDGETDKFSFKLSFAPPYLTHGSRIEFVVRFETPDGDYWANNKGMNYAVTLLLSYKDDLPTTSNVDIQDIRGILKPPKVYSMENDYEENLYTDKDGAALIGTDEGVVRPTLIPVIMHPEIDLETPNDSSRLSVQLAQDISSADGALNTATVSLGVQSPNVSSTTTLQSNEDPSCAPQAYGPPPSSEPEPLPNLDCESDDQSQEESRESNPSTLLSVPVPNTPSCSIDLAICEEQKGGSPNHTEPNTVPDPPQIEIHTDLPTQEDILKQDVLPTSTEVETEDEVQLSLEVEELKQKGKEKVSDTEYTQENTLLTQEPHYLSVSVPRNVPDPGNNPEHRSDPEICSGYPSGPSASEMQLMFNGSLAEEVKAEEISFFLSCDETSSPAPSMLTELSPSVCSVTQVLVKRGEPRVEFDAGEQGPLVETQGARTSTLALSQGVLDSDCIEEVHFEFQACTPYLSETQPSPAMTVGMQEPTTSSMNLSGDPSDKDHSESTNKIGLLKTENPTETLPCSPGDSGKETEQSDTRWSKEVVLLTETGPLLGNSQAHGEEISATSGTCVCPAVVTHLGPTGEDRVSPSLASHPTESSLDHKSLPVFHQRFKRGAATGLSELATVLLQESPGLKQQDENVLSTDISPVVESLVLSEAEVREEDTLIYKGSLDFTEDCILKSNQCEKGSLCMPSDASFELLQNTLSDTPRPIEPKAEPAVQRNYIPSIIFLGGAILLYVGLNEPSAFLFLGLFVFSLCF